MEIRFGQNIGLILLYQCQVSGSISNRYPTSGCWVCKGLVPLHDPMKWLRVSAAAARVMAAAAA